MRRSASRLQISHVHTRIPLCPRMPATLRRDSAPANSSGKAHFSELPHRPFQPYVARNAQGRRLCGTTWVPSNIDVTQNCQQPKGETLMFLETPHSSYS